MRPDSQGQRGDGDGGADDDPGGLDAVARVQPPDDHAPQRLAANVLWITDAAAVEKHATPVANRITRQGSEPEGHCGDHARNGCSSSPEATSQEQIKDEESRDQLDAGCNADPESLPAVAVCQ